MTAAPQYVPPQPGDADFMQAVVAGIRHMVGVLSEDTMHHLDNDETAEGAAVLLFDVRELRKALAEVEASIEATTAQRMTGKTLDVPGFVVERKGGAKQTDWRNDDVAWATIAALAVDGNGEVDDAAAWLVGEVRDRLMNAAHVDYWRVGQLRQYGVDPTKFSTWTKGRRTVHINRAVEVLTPVDPDCTAPEDQR